MNSLDTFIATMSNNNKEMTVRSYSNISDKDFSICVYENIEKRKEAKFYNRASNEVDYILRRLI